MSSANSHRHGMYGLEIAWIGLAGLACATTSCTQGTRPTAINNMPETKATFVGVHGRLSVKGNKIVDKNGNPTTLHGMSLYCWATQGTQFFNTSAINHLAQDWKCTVIRIAILPREYQQNPTAEMAKIKTVMDACIDNGIYAIIDWHSMGGAQNDLANSQNFFTAVATEYGKTPNIMYEPWNEPVQEAWPVIKAYHEAVISKIRPLTRTASSSAAAGIGTRNVPRRRRIPSPAIRTSPIRYIFTRRRTGSRCATTGRRR